MKISKSVDVEYCEECHFALCFDEETGSSVFGNAHATDTGWLCDDCWNTLQMELGDLYIEQLEKENNGEANENV